MSQLENSQVVGDYYRDHSFDVPDTCSVCGDEEIDMSEFGMGKLCSSCTRKCVICGDFMLDEVGVKDINCDVAHAECAEDWETNQ